MQPILVAIDSIAAHCYGYWSLASKTMRTARSWTSGENFGDFLMLAPFSIEGASSNAGRFRQGDSYLPGRYAAERCRPDMIEPLFVFSA